MMRLLIIAVAIAVFCLTGCESGEPQPDVVARVDGTDITRMEWDAAVQDLERQVGTRLDAAGRQKVLESLVQNRLMSNAARGLLDEKEMAELEAAASLHRERLLTKEYLRRTARPAPITGNMIEAYYAQHPEQFGARSIHRFEFLTTDKAPVAPRRKAVLDAMGEMRDSESWQSPPALDGVTWVHRLAGSGDAAMDARITGAAATLDEGETSDLLFINGKPYLLRGTRVEKRPPKPLPEVRAQVEQRLQLQRLQEAVDAAAETLRDEAQIDYLVPIDENE